MDEREHEHENDMKPRREGGKGKVQRGSCVHHRRELIHKWILVSGKEEKTISDSVVSFLTVERKTG